MSYFDNAATTFPKPECVYSFMNSFYREAGANVGRGNYQAAQSSKALVDDTRSRICQLLHCPAKQVIFTPSATIALNMIIQGVIKRGATTIYISPFEHNAVTRTLHSYEEKGEIKVIELSVNDELEFDLERIKYQFDAAKPDFVIMSHASNVIGLIAPVTDVFRLAKNYLATTLVDMAQTAGLVDCNIGEESFDFAVFAGHKTLLGPTGISGFVMKKEFDLPPVLFGGTGFESANQNMPLSLPERYEMGTMNIAGLAGLNASLRWIETQGVSQIYAKDQEMRSNVVELLQEYDFVKIVGNCASREYVGIVSFIIDGISSESAGEIFSRLNIAVRTGLQCAPYAHRFLGTFPAGTIRLSGGFFTTNGDLDELKAALDYIRENI